MPLVSGVGDLRLIPADDLLGCTTIATRLYLDPSNRRSPMRSSLGRSGGPERCRTRGPARPAKVPRMRWSGPLSGGALRFLTTSDSESSGRTEERALVIVAGWFQVD